MTPTELKDKIRNCCTEDGDCLIWNRAVNNHGVPMMHVPGRTGIHSVRRLVLEAKGQKVPDGYVATVTCGNSRCLEHLVCWTRQQLQLRTNGKLSSNLRRAAKMARIKRSTQAKLTQELVDRAREAGMTGPELARLGGISKGHANRVLRGDSWRDYSSPFLSIGRTA